MTPFGAGPSSSFAGRSTAQSFANVQLGVEVLARKGVRVNLMAYTNVFRSGVTEYGGGAQIGIYF